MAIAAFTIAYVPCVVAPPRCSARGGARRGARVTTTWVQMEWAFSVATRRSVVVHRQRPGVRSVRAQSLIERDIRVNAVAPGPVWTPTIPAPMSQARVERSGEQVLMGRAAHPDEIAQS